MSGTVRGVTERQVATALVAAAVLVTVAVTPRGDGVETFAWNFAWWMVPEALGIGVLLLVRARPALVSGAALAWAAYVAVFWRIVQSQPVATMTIVWYPVAFPGAVIGALGAWFATRRRFSDTATHACAIAAAAVATGLALSAWIPLLLMSSP